MPSRILIADDNVDAAESLSMLLEFDGLETRVAHDGQTALELAESFRPQIALLDIGMPVLDGFELARAIRATEWGKDLCLVAVTGWADENSRRKTSEAGFDHHVAKPIAVDQLKQIIAQRG